MERLELGNNNFTSEIKNHFVSSHVRNTGIFVPFSHKNIFLSFPTKTGAIF